MGNLLALLFQMMHPSLGSSTQRCPLCRDPLPGTRILPQARSGAVSCAGSCRQLQAAAAFPKPASSLWWLLPAIYIYKIYIYIYIPC